MPCNDSGCLVTAQEPSFPSFSLFKFYLFIFIALWVFLSWLYLVSLKSSLFCLSLLLVTTLSHSHNVLYNSLGSHIYLFHFISLASSSLASDILLVLCLWAYWDLLHPLSMHFIVSSIYLSTWFFVEVETLKRGFDYGKPLNSPNIFLVLCV